MSIESTGHQAVLDHCTAVCLEVLSAPLFSVGPCGEVSVIYEECSVLSSCDPSFQMWVLKQSSQILCSGADH